MLASASVAAASSAVSSSSFSASQAPRGMYVAHAQQPTVITQSLTCNLTSGSTTNLVLARCSRLDVMAVTPQGLQLLKELPIHGRVASLAAYLPPRSSQHRLLVLTEAHALFALSADAQSQQFSTAASVDLTHRVGQPSDHGPTVLVTPQANLIAVHAYEGVLSCIPVDAKGALGDVVDVRVEETRVLDLCFLLGHSRPVLCVLCSDYKDKRHVRSFVLDVREREAKPGPLTLPALDHCPVRIAPVDDGGVLVVGEEAAVLYSRDGRALCHVLLTPCTITSVCRIDATRFLVADLHGDLSMLIIQTQAQPPASSSSSSSSSSSAVRLHRELLGHTTIASTMSYLGDSAVFVGSTLGDHALLRLLTERGEDGGFVQVVDSFPNLGSIVDMAVMEVDGGQGQAQLVTCSGAFQCGTLRVVRNGVGVEEEASIELPGIQGMWAVRATDDSADDRLLLQSFVGETRVLVMEDDELGEIEMEGLDAALPTLWAGNVLGQHMVQVTERSVRVISISSSALVTEWKEGRITMASGNRRQVLLAQGRELVLLRWDGRRLVEERRVALEHEVACLDVTPIDDGGEARFAALGLWTDLTLRVLALPSLAEVSREAVGGEVIPRSVLLCPFSPSSVFLLAGLGDGQLLSLSLSTSSGALSGRKRLTLGSQPIALSPFRTGGRLHVFAACDRPTVVYCAQERLLYSTVNLKDVHHMASFSTSTFPASLAFASSTHLVIGPIDSIQKLHIQTVPLAAQPRKVAWFKDEHCLLVLVSRFVRDDSRRDTQGVQWRELSELLALDDEGFEVRSRVELARSEVGSALFVTREPLNGDAFVVVGATVMVADEPMPKRGRLLLLRVEGRQQLRLVSSTATKGAVTCIDQVLGRIAVGINSKVVVYRATREGGDTRLIAECSHVGKVAMRLAGTRCAHLRLHSLLTLSTNLFALICLVSALSLSLSLHVAFPSASHCSCLRLTAR